MWTRTVYAVDDAIDQWQRHLLACVDAEVKTF